MHFRNFNATFDCGSSFDSGFEEDHIEYSRMTETVLLRSGLLSTTSVACIIQVRLVSSCSRRTNATFCLWTMIRDFGASSESSWYAYLHWGIRFCMFPDYFTTIHSYDTPQYVSIIK